MQYEATLAVNVFIILYSGCIVDAANNSSIRETEIKIYKGRWSYDAMIFGIGCLV